MPGNTRNPIRRDWVISWDCRLWGSVFKQTQEPQAKAFAASIGCLLRGSHPNRLGPVCRRLPDFHRVDTTRHRLGPHDRNAGRRSGSAAIAIYRRAFFNVVRRRPEPFVLQAYALNALFHYHYHKLIATIDADGHLLNIF
jgi:hypothetical protein